MRLSIFVLSIIAVLAKAEASDKRLAACECDAPACRADLMSPESLCACLNNAAIFCWRRNAGVCASPTPQKCNAAAEQTTAATATTSPVAPTSSYVPPQKGSGGLNCVEIGYCSRPTRARTTITVTGPTGTAVITVPVGLPTGAYIPKASTTESTPIIIFNPGASTEVSTATGATSTPQPVSPPGSPPPVSGPPVAAPPIQAPPAQAPPVAAQPVQIPTVAAPPVEHPVVQAPPVQSPPVAAQPFQIQPAELPQQEAQPMEQQPPLVQAPGGAAAMMMRFQTIGQVEAQLSVTPTV